MAQIKEEFKKEEEYDDSNDTDYNVEEDSDTESDVSDISDQSSISVDSTYKSNLIKIKELQLELQYERLSTIEKLKIYEFKVNFYLHYKYMYYISLFMNIVLLVTHILTFPNTPLYIKSS